MKKVKKILALLLVAIMAFSLVGCGSSSDADYIIASDTTFAPFEYADASGTYVGIDVDIINAIAEDQGFTIEVQHIGFDAALAAVQSGQADGVIAGCSITDVRKETYDFSDSYYSSGVVMGIAQSNTSITSYNDLSGKKLAVKSGTEGYAWAELNASVYGFTYDVYEDSSAMYLAVSSGGADACFEDYAVLGYGISTGSIPLKIVTEAEPGTPYGFAVLKGENAELLSMFNAGLANIMANGTYDEIIAKYIQE